MKVNASMALESLGFLYTYVSVYLKKDDQEIPITMDPMIKEWLDETDASISSFLRNDLEFLFAKFHINNWVIFYQLHKEKMETAEEFLEHLKRMSEEEFRDLYLKIADIHKILLEKLTPRMIKSKIEAHFFMKSEGQEKTLLQLFKEPGEWKKRIIETYEKFYTTYFLPHEDEIRAVLSQRIPEVKQKLAQDPDGYLDAISIGHYKTVLGSRKDVALYVSYCYDRGFTISLKDPIFWFGLRRERLLEEIDRKAKSELLFNSLSDPKRVEIIRLCAKRTWYSNELAKHFGITSATMSYHINKLLSAGLLTFEVGEQNKVYYQINRKIMESLLNAAHDDLLGEP